jgi:hypothetical protein
MSRKLESLKAALGDSCRAVADGLSLALALTDTELVTAKPKLFGGVILTRYPLAEVTAIEHMPNPTANRLTIRLRGGSVQVLYGAEEASAYQSIMALLNDRLRSTAA